MHTSAYRRQVLEAYHGEVMGEALFSALLDNTPPSNASDGTSPDGFAARDHAFQRQLLATMLQLEGETKLRLRALVHRMGLPVTEPEAARASGRQWGINLATTHRDDWAAALLPQLAPYVAAYRELQAAAPAQDRAVLGFLACHEHTLHAALSAWQQGRHASALQTLNALLTFPLPPATP